MFSGNTETDQWYEIGLISVGWQMKKDPDLGPSPLNQAKYFLKTFLMAILISSPRFIIK